MSQDFHAERLRTLAKPAVIFPIWKPFFIYMLRVAPDRVLRTEVTWRGDRDVCFSAH